MASGSLTSGSFNPASYTRHLLGSPLSFRAGSFGSRFYPGVSPGQLLGPLDPTDFKFGKVSSSVESDRGSIFNAFTIQEREDELCRNYTCCGLNLTDLHALLEHFEECHVVVVDPFHPHHPQLQVQISQNQPPQNMDLGTAVEVAAQNATFVGHQQPHGQGYHNQGPFDPDDMEMDMENNSTPSSGAPSPPDTPISTPLSGYPSPTAVNGGNTFPHGQVYSNPTSASTSACPSPISAFDTTTVLSNRSLLSVSTFPATRDILNNNGYHNYNEPFSASGMINEGVDSAPHTPLTPDGCVPPALLFSASSTPVTTPSSSRVNSPAPNSYFSPQAVSSGSSSLNPNKASTSASASAARASTTLSRPSSSLLLSKPFKCPKPNCNKSYKQANGLKYHITHGSCSFGPAKELGEVQAVLKEREREGSEGEPLTEREMMEVEREAERRLRPFACGVGDCQRRYKNMNGLRYHYQHSGDHGSIGLALLASGQHECLRNAHGRRDGSRDRNANSAAAQQQRQAQTTFSSNPQPQQAPQYSQSQPQPQPQPQSQPPTFATAYTVQPAQSQQQQWTAPMMVYNVQMQPPTQPPAPYSS
ncbi:hypothetical protein NEOLEDRAFT_1159354 [Neolentinus lepideus HHB14362 ss-1]|uniref:C2H2-type domain-containing protein n=1 Tax=Neolentinus lepideus HHB14362 ss-1 TaxID=1314782 RepID=A0A165MU18_9AGAM|nr:hypothetical protein NEOLEDRAFT_1159354 [Neolentinus lepideus HHB14362 ss-1]